MDRLWNLRGVANLVFNDDTPGQRQFRDVEAPTLRRANRRNISIEEARCNTGEGAA